MKDVSVGRAIDRVDGPLKVTGKAQYAAEIPVANVSHAVIVTSAIARGKLLGVDASRAEKVPGVLRVISAENAPHLPGAKTKSDPNDRLLQVLQDDEIHYADQPIALVVADTLEHAQEAASLVTARYASSAPSVGLTTHAADEYAPQKAGPAGSAASKRGDLDAGLTGAAARVDQLYTTPVQNHNPMEPHALTVVWQGDDHVTLYDTSQGIFGVKKKVSALFGIPAENVRVISRYVGGGFGCKGSPWSHIGLAALAARVVKRPVKLALTRQQMFSLVGHRPPTVQRVVLAAARGGKLTAMQHESWSETSRFDEFVEPAAVQTRMLYSCPNVVTSHRLVRLDVPTPTFMRAPGEATGTFALESAMDELAFALELDPIELRLRNYAERDEGEDKPWSSKSLRECYRQGAGRFGWSKRRAEPRSQRDGHHLVGYGMASATYPARQSGASAIARLRRDGRVLVQAGSQDIGTGTYTIMAQIAADALGIPVEHVQFELGDTALPETPVSGGSQTASSTGSAVKLAALALREKLIGLAIADRNSPLYGVAAKGVNFSTGELTTSDGSRKDSFSALLERSGQPELSAQASTTEKEQRKNFSLHSFGAHFVEVRVDEDTGEVRVARALGAFAAGKILNPKTARSQFLGGMVWGIGFALEEHTVRDPRTGRVVTRDLADYHVPVHADVPALEVISIPEDDPYVNEIGAKGIGEIGITGITAAIANAVFNATGKRVRDLPITLDKLI
ncbi:MAG TPA: xanthine dehydrogenase family protein molybdopterin-binding subunit [Polyangiaceae bacterium]|nr:xanthine dehydrogenase family protein molybdopterin-binding subunit [Polyangiaceae bacterium]